MVSILNFEFRIFQMDAPKKAKSSDSESEIVIIKSGFSSGIQIESPGKLANVVCGSAHKEPAVDNLNFRT